MTNEVHVVNLDMAPFVPYIYGTLRMHAEADPVVAANYEFPDPFFFRMTPAEIMAQMHQPAVLGLSNYVWNFRKHMKVARLCKERYPETLVVAGGPHIPDHAEGFFARHPYVDIVVHGEGELAFQRILRERLTQRPDWSAVPGISFLHNGETVTTSRTSMELETVTRSPYIEGYLDSAIDFLQRLNMPFYAPWETNRGCPYSCSFCDWGSATMSKVRRFTEERLREEIAFFGRAEIPLVHINDANFGMLTRDVDLATELAVTREKYGYPQEIRCNFAKNSNDRVFQVSKMWNDHGMLHSTTLSMQATNNEVLAAIARKNIPRQQYRELQERYTEAGVNTYTEVILALPEETRESFKSGLDYVLDMGNHDDVRIYELGILPNAPIAAPAMREKYRLHAIEKELMPPIPGWERPADETETMQIVIETSTMSQRDWVDCSVYARLLQTLHVCCYTRYLAMYLRHHYDLPYHQFYATLQEHFAARADTVLGPVLDAFRRYYEQYQKRPELPPEFDPAMTSPAVMALIEQRMWVPKTEWAWLCLAVDQDRFYQELGEFLPELGLPLGAEVDELVRYQQDLMLRLDYDEGAGKTCDYSYDFPGYFHNQDQDQDLLVARPTRIHYRDTHLGANRMPLAKNDPAKFVNAALPSDWADVRGHYRHQLAAAEIVHPAGVEG